MKFKERLPFSDIVFARRQTAVDMCKKLGIKCLLVLGDFKSHGRWSLCINHSDI